MKIEYFLLKLRVDFVCGYKYRDLKISERIEKPVIRPQTITAWVLRKKPKKYIGNEQHFQQIENLDINMEKNKTPYRSFILYITQLQICLGSYHKTGYSETA